MLNIYIFYIRIVKVVTIYPSASAKFDNWISYHSYIVRYTSVQYFYYYLSNKIWLCCDLINNYYTERRITIKAQFNDFSCLVEHQQIFLNRAAIFRYKKRKLISKKLNTTFSSINSYLLLTVLIYMGIIGEIACPIQDGVKFYLHNFLFYYGRIIFKELFFAKTSYQICSVNSETANKLYLKL